jgi:hypothetical protein
MQFVPKGAASRRQMVVFALALCVMAGALGVGVVLDGRSAFGEQPEVEQPNGADKPIQATDSQKKQDKTKALLEEISDAIEAYRDIEIVGTDVAVAQKKTAACEKLMKKFEGRDLLVALPIANVSAGSSGVEFLFGTKESITLFRWRNTPKDGGGNTRQWRDDLVLTVLKPSIHARNRKTGQSVEVKPIRKTTGRFGPPQHYTIHGTEADLPADQEIEALTVILLKEDALKIDENWTLEISGKIRVSLANGSQPHRIQKTPQQRFQFD